MLPSLASAPLEDRPALFREGGQGFEAVLGAQHALVAVRFMGKTLFLG